MNLLVHRQFLIIEDDIDTAKLMRHLLEQFADAQCDLAFNSYEAIKALCEKEYDMVILDQHLPDMNGLELLITLDAHLSQDPKLDEHGTHARRVPVVLMSANTVHLPRDMDFNFFDIIDNIDKQNLSGSISALFAS